jgi:DNA polymerase-3 subunit gamma/tau
MSDQYIVSARKYRPQTFETVVGQEHITTTLKNAIRNNHLAHAYLFCGPRGVGKTTCARILARTINCEHPTADTEACGTCPTCLSFSNNASFNVFELDAASNNSVDDIRTLTDQVRFAPQQGKYKIYIIDEVHMLSSAAFNAFLKTLEEPPSYAIFILATTEKHKILPTILSRCQIFDFKRITTNDTVQHLQNIAGKEHIHADEAALHIIAQKSEGCMRDALSILDRIASFTNGQLTYSSTMEHLNQLDADFYFSITDTMLAQDVAGTLLQLDDVLERGFEGDVILSGLAEHFRNLLLCKDARMARLLDVPNNHRPIYHEKAGQTPPSFILSALNVVNESELSYKNANNRRLHIEICLIRLCYLLQATTAQADEKKNTGNGLNTPPTPIPAPNPAIAAVPSAPPAQAFNAPADPMPAKPVPAPSYAAPVPDTIPAKPIPAPEPIPAKPVPAPAYPNPAPANNIVAEPAATAAMPTRANPFARSGAESTPTGVRRISRSMLQQAGTVQEEAARMSLEEVSLEMIQQYFDEYTERLRAESKSVLYAQFSLMRLELSPEKEIKIVSPTSITDMYAQDQRADLQEYLKQQTGHLLRITTMFTETEPEVKERVLTRDEIFQQMGAKNPSLFHLREALKLSLDY